MKENKLSKFNPENLPVYFDKLSEEQQSKYLEQLASNNADLMHYAAKKVADSKTAEHDMATDLDYLSRLETENKMINVKRTYETGSGRMEITIKGGDRRLILPILAIVGVVLLVAVVLLMLK